MIQFLEGSDTQYDDLERRSRNACVVFRDQEMPPGANPDKARIGFEVAPDTGAALLLVDHGVVYSGSSVAIREWLSAGEKHFSSFAALRAWIRDCLGPCYHAAPGRPTSDSLPALTLADTTSTPSPGSLTDVDAVREKLEDPHGPIYVDETALFRELSRRVLGQDEALRTMSGAVCRHLARRSPRRPTTVFAVGPTGVGKTRTAESVPPALRAVAPKSAEYGYLRLDMAEYQERHRVSQLIGSPQGYVGYGDGAQLVDRLRDNPKTIVLFDEIEKAHPDVLRCLMNAMDAGRLSTAAGTTAGREIDCRFALFFFTSNLDSKGTLDDLEQRSGFDQPVIVDEVCRRRLRAAGVPPEITGRIGSFLVYRPLTHETRAEILTLAIARVGKEYGVQVANIEPEVVAAILNQSPSDGFGARPDEYIADAFLGAAFAESARRNGSEPVRVVAGPPMRCEPTNS